jgi:hypothetical protein
LYCLDTTPLSDNLNPGALARSKWQEFLGKTTSTLQLYNERNPRPPASPEQANAS